MPTHARWAESQPYHPTDPDHELHYELRTKKLSGDVIIDPLTGWPVHKFDDEPDPGDGGEIRLDCPPSLFPTSTSAWTCARESDEEGE